MLGGQEELTDEDIVVGGVGQDDRSTEQIGGVLVRRSDLIYAGNGDAVAPRQLCGGRRGGFWSGGILWDRCRWKGTLCNK